MAFAWTKFQDFYLRLGYLKVLVSALDASRRSAINDAVERRLRTPMFAPAENYEPLWSRVRGQFPPRKDAPTGLAGAKKFTTVAEAQLVAADCPSLLFAITPETAYKVLDWGHDVQLMGRGNQITERSLLLRTLMPMKDAERFLAGDVDAWNPFVLTPREKIFFLFHLGQLDNTLIELIDRLAALPQERTLESSDAAKLLCGTLLKFLEEVEGRLALRDAPAFRVARDLACVIADEQGMLGEAKICGGGSALNQIGRRGAKRPGLLPAGKVQRKANKNSDHQTIPRFEQLADLGFVTKRAPDASDDRRRWRYWPSARCKEWHSIRARFDGAEAFFLDGFAKAVVAAFGLGDASQNVSEETVASYLWKAYQDAHRPVGHTPFDSVALLGLIYAAEDGIPIELGRFHKLMLRIKNEDLLPGVAFFASGNEIDKMFIVLKPGFMEALMPKLDAGSKT